MKHLFKILLSFILFQLILGLSTYRFHQVYIVDESFINWGESYNVYLRSILEDGSYSSWLDSLIIRTHSIPEHYSNLNVETNIFIDSHYQPGITFLQKTIINKNGENDLFWKTPEIDHDGMNFTYVNVLNNGNLLLSRISP